MIHWAPGGEYIYFQRMGAPEGQEERGVWRVPMDGGQPEQLDWSFGDECILSGFHPSGHRVALTCSEGEGGDEVWVMENFLPGPEENESGRRAP
jgi:Tol biopolymer transport system component